MSWFRRRRNFTVTVQDSHTLSPINRAQIVAKGPSDLAGSTESNEKIVFDKVKAGDYSITASAAGYAPSTPLPISVKDKLTH
jgi:hypothetical protein